jgi:LPXTG-motif cell wall-anchored protein
VVPTGGTVVAASPRLALTTANVASLAVDGGSGTAGACLGEGPIELTLTTDRPLTVRFVDGRTVSVVAAGAYQLTVPSLAEVAGLGGAGAEVAGTELAKGPVAPSGTTVSLPATGGDRGVPSALAVLALLSGLAAAVLVRRAAS